MGSDRKLTKPIADLLCEESWHGRWPIMQETNLRPMAEVTAETIVGAGYMLVPIPQVRAMTEKANVPETSERNNE